MNWRNSNTLIELLSTGTPFSDAYKIIQNNAVSGSGKKNKTKEHGVRKKTKMMILCH